MTMANQITSEAARIALDTSKANLEKARTKHREAEQHYSLVHTDHAWGEVEQAERLARRAELDVQGAERRLADAVAAEKAEEIARDRARLAEIRATTTIPRFRQDIAALVEKRVAAERALDEVDEQIAKVVGVHRERYVEGALLAEKLGEQLGLHPDPKLVTRARIEIAFANGSAPSDNLERALFVENALRGSQWLGPAWDPVDRLRAALDGTYDERAREINQAKQAEHDAMQKKHAAEMRNEQPPRSYLGPKADRGVA